MHYVIQNSCPPPKWRCGHPKLLQLETPLKLPGIDNDLQKLSMWTLLVTNSTLSCWHSAERQSKTVEIFSNCTKHLSDVVDVLWEFWEWINWSFISSVSLASDRQRLVQCAGLRLLIYLCILFCWAHLCFQCINSECTWVVLADVVGCFRCF